MKWSDLRDGFAQQYRRSIESQGEQALVQLKCSSCHRTDEFQSAGAYFLPVKYADDCRACHPLNYEANGSEMPHGLTAQAMSKFLAGRYLLDRESGDSESPLIRRRPIPGRSPGEFDEPNDEASTKLKVAAAEQYLIGNKVCEKCHSYAAAENPANQSLLRDVEPANIPQVWLKHARFDHKAHPPHRVLCVKCHEQASSDNVVAQRKSADGVQPMGPNDQDVVMIAGRVTCLECHAERSTEKPQGGARFDCVECHRYHAAEHQ
jgi:hypothetical protein